MSRRTGMWMLSAAAVIGLGLVSYALAQDAGGGNNGGGRGGRGGRGGNFDPAQMREQQQQRLKESLGVTDEEWKALQPKVEKVQAAEEDIRTSAFYVRGGMMGFRRGGAGGGAAQPAPQMPEAKTDLQKKAQELRKVLDNKESKSEEVKAALTAYRDARAKARAELEKAQKDLKEVLTVKQEAQLVAQGTLE